MPHLVSGRPSRGLLSLEAWSSTLNAWLSTLFPCGGWRALVAARLGAEGGGGAGHRKEDVYFLSPSGKRFRTFKAVMDLAREAGATESGLERAVTKSAKAGKAGDKTWRKPKKVVRAAAVAAAQPLRAPVLPERGSGRRHAQALGGGGATVGSPSSSLEDGLCVRCTSLDGLQTTVCLPPDAVAGDVLQKLGRPAAGDQLVLYRIDVTRPGESFVRSFVCGASQPLAPALQPQAPSQRPLVNLTLLTLSDCARNAG